MVPTFEELQRAVNDPDRMKTLKRYMGGSYGYLMGYQDAAGYHGRTLSKDALPILSDRPPRGEEMLGSPNSPNHGVCRPPASSPCRSACHAYMPTISSSSRRA